jgi:methylmalonyl-CoA/ethylmalonyl-CoA epimerase
MEKASRDYERLWGAPTENVYELTSEGALYHGEPTTLVARYGFIRTGASEIELIEPVSAVSPYRDFLRENGGDGAHHLAYMVDAIDPYLDRLREAGALDLVLDAPLKTMGGRFVYVGGAAHGPVIELIETTGQR